ncbi:hypothetical protein [Tardiphaga sp.]|uniref:primase-helicase family protein n=1 Tax=Tardiphaga sp. TaxID=1926292 RepID=UPI00262796DB|nr:hypothetical protein [Tardiphaga sp.]
MDYVRSRIGLPPFLQYQGRGDLPAPPNLAIKRAAVMARAVIQHTAPEVTLVSDAMEPLITPVAAVSRVVATYDYCNVAGVLQYQVQRLEPKSFRQRRPVGDGWSWNLGDVQRLLYRLPELRKSAVRTVFIVEGEKDSDRLLSLNCCATTISGGSKWTSDIVAPLKDRDVFILPDNDTKGAEKAIAAATVLYGVAATVRVVQLPDLPEKGDVSDWLDVDPKRADGLVDICMNVPLWAPPAADVVGSNNDGVVLDDFYAYLPAHSYIFIPSREMWPAASVNARIPRIENIDGKSTRASDWLDMNRAATQMTWSPGMPLEIHDKIISDGGWIERQGVTCLNLYRGPTIRLRSAAGADRWVEHCYKVYPADAPRLIVWLAHRVQRPQEKINHALFLGGAPGIGKDSLLAPVKHAVGAWNFQEVAPKTMLGQFNGYAKAVIIRVSEARDLGDVNRFSFYETSKVYCAAPPDVLRVNEKHWREHYVPNVCGIIFTSNYRTDGIYLPADDRRHDVMWSDAAAADFSAGYWTDLWSWYAHGGYEDIAAYLNELDISEFDPAAPPPKGPAFWSIVEAGAAPEEAEVADVLDRLSNPSATTVAQLTGAASGGFFEWIVDRKNRRAIPHRLEKCGYVPIRNDDTKQGLWIINGSRQVIYGRTDLSVRDRFLAATELVRKGAKQ